MGLKESLLKELKARKNEMNEELIQLSKEKDIKKVEKEKLVKDIDNLSGKIHEEKEELEYLTQEIKERKETVAYLEHKIRQKEEQIRNYDIDIESNLSILHTMHNEILTKSKDLNKKYTVEFEDGEVLRLSEEDLKRSSILEDFSNDTLKDLSYKYPITIADIMRLAEIAKNEIIEWVEKKRIPKKIYEELSIDNEPLPRSLYVDHKKGKGIAQIHFRNITKEEYKSLEGKPIYDILSNHPIHIDLRVEYPNTEEISQYVITGKNVNDIINTIKGNDIYSIVTKNESESWIKMSPEDSKTLKDIIIDEESYWIEPGNPGATKSTYSYMGLIWIGDVSTGIEREDFHELFLNKENSKEDLLDGKYIIKCLKKENEPARWEMFKSIKDLKPLDPIKHCDTGHHQLSPADKVSKYGRDESREESQEKFKSKLR